MLDEAPASGYLQHVFDTSMKGFVLELALDLALSAHTAIAAKLRFDQPSLHRCEREMRDTRSWLLRYILGPTSCTRLANPRSRHDTET